MPLRRLETIEIVNDSTTDTNNHLPRPLWVDVSRVVSITGSVDDDDRYHPEHHEFTPDHAYLALVTLDNGHTFLMEPDAAGELIELIGFVDDSGKVWPPAVHLPDSNHANQPTNT